MATEGAQVKRKRGGSRFDSSMAMIDRWGKMSGLPEEADDDAGSLTQLYLQQLQNSHTLTHTHMQEMYTPPHPHTRTLRRYCDVGGHLPSWWLPPCWKGSSPRGRFRCGCRGCSPSIGRQNAAPEPARGYAPRKINRPSARKQGRLICLRPHRHVAREKFSHNSPAKTDN